MGRGRVEALESVFPLATWEHPWRQFFGVSLRVLSLQHLTRGDYSLSLMDA